MMGKHLEHWVTDGVLQPLNDRGTPWAPNTDSEDTQAQESTEGNAKMAEAIGGTQEQAAVGTALLPATWEAWTTATIKQQPSVVAKLSSPPSFKAFFYLSDN